MKPRHSAITATIVDALAEPGPVSGRMSVGVGPPGRVVLGTGPLEPEATVVVGPFDPDSTVVVVAAAVVIVGPVVVAPPTVVVVAAAVVVVAAIVVVVSAIVVVVVGQSSMTTATPFPLVATMVPSAECQ